MDLRLERDREGGLDIGLSGGKTVIVRQPPQINPVGWTFLLVEVEKTTIAVELGSERRGQNEAACAQCAVAATLNLNRSHLLLSSTDGKLVLAAFSAHNRYCILIFWRRGWSWRWTSCQVNVNGCEAGNQLSGIYNSHNSPVCMFQCWYAGHRMFFLQHIFSNRKPKYPCFLLSSWFKYFALALFTILSFFFSLLPQMLGRPPLDAPHLPQPGRILDWSHFLHTFEVDCSEASSARVSGLAPTMGNIPGSTKSNQKTKF